MRLTTVFLPHCLTSSTLSLSTNLQVGPLAVPLVGSFSLSPENPYLVYAILKYRHRFEAVREFTLESGQQEIERQNEKKKAASASDVAGSPTLSHPEDDLHTPSGARSPLDRIPEENSPFAIGDDDSDDERDVDAAQTPSQSSPSAQTSRRPSVASTIDENGASMIRGMSEKARGKKPAGHPPFSRQNSMTSQTSMTAFFAPSASGFTPTVPWVGLYSNPLCFGRPNVDNIFSSNPGYPSFLFTRF